MRNKYRVLVLKHERKRLIGRTEHDRRMILKWILKK
jgi:hypothetical protein